MSDDELQNLKALAAKATNGPWERYGYIGQSGGLRRVRSTNDRPWIVCECNAGIEEQDEGMHNAGFIVAARNHIDQLIAIAEAAMEFVNKSKASARIGMNDETWAAYDKLAIAIEGSK
jgi:hypothetical protein